MIKKLFVKIILCGLCVLLTASLIMLLIGSICDDYSDNSDISDFCDDITSNIDEDVLNILTIVGGVLTGVNMLIIVGLIILLCCCI